MNKLYPGVNPVQALSDVSLHIPQGSLFGIIGPDGAGKTTLFRILTSLILADTGEVVVADLDVKTDYRQLRRIIGYMPGRFSLYQDLTVEENIQFYANIFNVSFEENYHLVKQIYDQLAPFSDRRAGALSGGMKQKLALCCALIHKPDVLFLDEPTTGVDVVSRREFWQMLHSLKEGGMTIVVSTPYMDEAAACDTIALLHEGRILAVDKPSLVSRLLNDDLFALKCADKAGVRRILASLADIRDVYLFGEVLHVKTPSGRFIEESLRSFVSSNGIKYDYIERIEPGIEDCFIHLMDGKQAFTS